MSEATQELAAWIATHARPALAPATRLEAQFDAFLANEAAWRQEVLAELARISTALSAVAVGRWR